MLTPSPQGFPSGLLRIDGAIVSPRLPAKISHRHNGRNTVVLPLLEPSVDLVVFHFAVSVVTRIPLLDIERYVRLLFTCAR